MAVDLNTIATLEAQAASAVSTYQNDTQTVSVDQTKIQAAQEQLAKDTDLQASDGTLAYNAVLAVVNAWNELLGTLPKPNVL